jgi:hypothetical protein
MGHLIFFVLHILAFLCGFFGLFITIPLHVIYTAIETNKVSIKVVRKSEPQNIGHLIGLCIRVVLIFIAGIVVLLLFLKIYSSINGRLPWQ